MPAIEVTVPEPTVRVVKYEISCLPETSVNRVHWTVTVEYRGDSQWAVCNFGSQHQWGRNDEKFSFGYSWRDGTREPTTDEEWTEYQAGRALWLNDHRFSLDEALEIAKRIAPEIRVNGKTVADVLRWEAEVEAREHAG